jgi:hypothetical protein
MALFAITFRINDDAEYEERYSSVTAAIEHAGRSGKHWKEPTSFYLITYSGNSETLANEIQENSLFAPDRDLLLVINLSQRGYKPAGKIRDRDLYELMGLRAAA